MTIPITLSQRDLFALLTVARNERAKIKEPRTPGARQLDRVINTLAKALKQEAK